MAVKLHKSWTDALARRPETGMGYQIVELRGIGLRPQHIVVVNGMEAVEPARGRLVVSEGVEKSVVDRVVTALSKSASDTSFRVLSRVEAVAIKAIDSRSLPGTGPASEAPLESSKPQERFLRYSAYANDVRILADGSVLPGTYVTTYDDGMTHVKTGRDAVRRYALPNPTPAIHRYHLKPPEPVTVRRGTVQPAFGQPGGGVEVIFETGSPPGTGTKEKQDQIPPE
jgi:hypothetical protein